MRCVHMFMLVLVWVNVWCFFLMCLCVCVYVMAWSLHYCKNGSLVHPFSAYVCVCVCVCVFQFVLCICVWIYRFLHWVHFVFVCISIYLCMHLCLEFSSLYSLNFMCALVFECVLCVHGGSLKAIWDCQGTTSTSPGETGDDVWSHNERATVCQSGILKGVAMLDSHQQSAGRIVCSGRQTLASAQRMRHGFHRA